MGINKGKLKTNGAIIETAKAKRGVSQLPKEIINHKLPTIPAPKFKSISGSDNKDIMDKIKFFIHLFYYNIK